MNSAEAIVGELVPGQEEPLQHVDDTPPSAVVADDAPAASQQDLVDLPVAEATEISDQTVLAAEEPIPSVSEKSDVAEPDPTSVTSEEALTSEESTEAPKNSSTIPGDLPSGVEDLKAEEILEDHPVESTKVVDEDVPQSSTTDAEVVEAQSTEDHIADDPIEASVPEQPIEVDGTPVVEEEVPTDDVVAPPAHDIPIDNDVEAVAEPAPVTEPILEALEESTPTDAVDNDVTAEALLVNEPIITHIWRNGELFC